MVGDNVDKTYAVKDRINFKHLSTDATMIVREDINFKMLYPSEADKIQLVSNFETLVTRLIIERVPGLQCLSADVCHHIEHQYSKNMALKSEVVCLLLLFSLL